MNKDTTTTKENSIPIFPVDINTKKNFSRDPWKINLTSHWKTHTVKKFIAYQEWVAILAFENK